MRRSIILVGDLSKSTQKPWGEETGFVWPAKIESVDAYEFFYPGSVMTSNTRAQAVTALGNHISESELRIRSQELRAAATNPNRFSQKRRAPYVILIGYGYGGLLCERVSTAATIPSNASIWSHLFQDSHELSSIAVGISTVLLTSLPGHCTCKQILAGKPRY